MIDFKAEIDEMANLPDGWDSYDAKPPTLATRERAKNLVDRLILADIPNITFDLRVNADVCGGVAFQGYKSKEDRGFWWLSVYDVEENDCEDDKANNQNGAGLGIFIMKDRAVFDSPFINESGLTDGNAINLLSAFLRGMLTFN